ncbi:hypothetical protein BC829DRAFT_490436 [Chytridium lagenaria]|nr:hypothetical protein BC829DRAFT_490436 [Chytridium lagenaria]
MRREGKVRCDAFNGQLVATNKTVRRLQRPEENLLPRLFLTNDPTISTQAFKNPLQDLARREKRMQEIKSVLNTSSFLRLSELPKPHLTNRRTKASPLQSCEHLNVDCGVPISDHHYSSTLRRLLCQFGLGENRDWGSLSDDEILRIREMDREVRHRDLWKRMVKNVYASEEDARKRVERDKWRVMARTRTVGCPCCVWDSRSKGERKTRTSGFGVARMKRMRGVDVEDAMVDSWIPGCK